MDSDDEEGGCIMGFRAPPAAKKARARAAPKVVSKVKQIIDKAKARAKPKPKPTATAATPVLKRPAGKATRRDDSHDANETMRKALQETAKISLPPVRVCASPHKGLRVGSCCSGWGSDVFALENLKVPHTLCFCSDNDSAVRTLLSHTHTQPPPLFRRLHPP